MTVEISDTASCLSCGYSLRGLPQAVCPECGRAFIPGDRTTYTNGQTESRWPFQSEAPPRWQAVVLPVGALVYLYWSSEPGGLLASVGFGACIVIPVGLAAIAVAALDYYGRIVALRADRRRASLDRGDRPRERRWRWAVFPVFLALILSVFVWSWPLQVRFRMSKPAFDRAVYRIQTGTDPQSLRGQFGLYEVEYVRVWEPGTVYFQTGMSGFDSVGLVYRSSGKPVNSGERRLARVWFADTQ